MFYPPISLLSSYCPHFGIFVQPSRRFSNLIFQLSRFLTISFTASPGVIFYCFLVLFKPPCSCFMDLYILLPHWNSIVSVSSASCIISVFSTNMCLFICFDLFLTSWRFYGNIWWPWLSVHTCDWGTTNWIEDSLCRDWVGQQVGFTVRWPHA